MFIILYHLAHRDIFRAKVGRGGTNVVYGWKSVLRMLKKLGRKFKFAHKRSHFAKQCLPIWSKCTGIDTSASLAIRPMHAQMFIYKSI